jgi:hypothetical protein
VKVFYVSYSSYPEDGFKVVAANSEEEALTVANFRWPEGNVVWEVVGATAEGEPRELVLT